MIEKISCDHCGFTVTVNARISKKIPLFGARIQCKSCANFFHLLRLDQDYRALLIPELAAFVLKRKEEKRVSNLKYEIDRIKSFGGFLTSVNKNYLSAEKKDIVCFIKREQAASSADLPDGMYLCLCHFYAILTSKGLIKNNPCKAGNHQDLDQAQKPGQPSKLPKPGLSPKKTDGQPAVTGAIKAVHKPQSSWLDKKRLPSEVSSYLEKKAGSDSEKHHYFEKKRLQVLFIFLTEKGKSVKTATSEDLNNFLTMAKAKLKPEQLKGFQITLTDLYDYLLFNQTISENPMIAVENNMLTEENKALNSALVQKNVVEGVVCPKCGAEQFEEDECLACGIIFKKYIKKQEEIRGMEQGFNNLPEKERPDRQSTKERDLQQYHPEKSQEPSGGIDLIGYVHAGFWNRFGAFMIDAFFITFIEVIISVMVSPRTPAGIGNLSLLFVLLQCCYFTFMESSGKQGTLGKMAIGLLVVDSYGNQISKLKSFLRYLSKLVSIISVIGFPMAGFTKDKQALHDIIVGTYVIKSG